MTKLEQLKGMIAEWKETKSISLADEICEFLVTNLKEHGGEL